MNAATRIAEAQAYGHRMGSAERPSYAAAFGHLSGSLQAACNELARYTGASLGMGNWIEKELDGAKVFVDCEYSEMERRTWTEPGCSGGVTITGVLINGVVVEPSLLCERVVRQWEEEIAAAMAEGVAA